MYVMQEYDDALEKILKKGVWKSNKRTNTRTLALCGVNTRYSLTDAFPVMSRRKYYPKAVFAELLWFISGSTNNEDLKKLGCNFWTPWVSEEFEKKHGFVSGSFGPVYGFQLRHFGGFYGDGSHRSWNHDDERQWLEYYGNNGFDQLAYMMQRIKEDPSCRRILFSIWNPKDLDKQRLPPCHYTYQIMIDDDNRMSGHLTQRSNDYFIGNCANIQFYSALTCMIAQQTGYTPYEFVHEAVDAHIYEPQIPFVEEYLATPIIDSPTLELNKASDIYSYKLTDFNLVGFQSGPVIKAPVMV